MSVDVAVRLGLKGGKEVERGLEDIGKTGGGALRGLKAAGAVAAVALSSVAAAATLAFGQVKSATAFAASLEDTAAAAGVSTTALQEWQYAVLQSGGKVEDVGTALAQLNQRLQDARQGLKEAQRPFAELGISDAQLRSFKSVDEALPVIAEKLQAVGNAAQRAGIADKLGLGPLVPALKQTTEELDAVRQAAHEAGFVMGEDLVKQGAAANAKFDALVVTLSTRLKVAFVELAPLLSATAGEFETINSWVTRASASVEKFFGMTSKGQLAQLQDQLAQAQNRAGIVRSGMRPGDAESARTVAAAEAEVAAIRVRMLQLRVAEGASVYAPRADPTGAPVNLAGGVDDRAASAAAERGRRAAEAAAKAAADELRRRREYLSGLAQDLDRAAEEEIAERRDFIRDLSGFLDEAAAAERERAMEGADRVRDSIATPEQSRDRALAELDAIRSNAAGTEAALSQEEYARAVERVTDEYIEQKAAIIDATAAGRVMNALISGQIRTWSDLGRVALSVLADIVARAGALSMAGQGGGGFGGFFSNLLKAGGQALGGSGFGFGGGGGGDFNLPDNFGSSEFFAGGLATGGPFYRGQRRMTGERGRELMSARSDGFVTDAATTAAALRGMQPRYRPDGGDGGVQVVLNNGSPTQLQATATRDRDPEGRPRVRIDLAELADARIERRFGEMLDGGRDDLRLANRFGVRRQLSGN